MNFEIDKDLFEITKTNEKVRCSFKNYARERPEDVIGYNLYQAFSVDRLKMPRVVDMMEKINILNLVFDN
jgi:hypothetical protein